MNMKWQQLDTEKKTWVFLGLAGVALLWLLVPSEVTKPKQAPPQPQKRQAPKTTNAPAGNQAVRNGAAAPAPAPRPVPVKQPFQEVLGQYAGREMLSDLRGNCALRLELRRSDKPGEFVGFTNLICRPNLAHVREESKRDGKQLADAKARVGNATLATLSGTAEGGSIRLHAVSNFGVRDAREGCAMTALTVTPAGTDTIDVDWQEAQDPDGFCRGAQMQMRKFSR
jgi:hypothetical protein